MIEVGETVQLTAPEAMCDDGGLIFHGTKGKVVGRRGFGELVVAWGTEPPYRYGVVRENDVVRR